MVVLALGLPPLLMGMAADGVFTQHSGRVERRAEARGPSETVYRLQLNLNGQGETVAVPYEVYRVANEGCLVDRRPFRWWTQVCGRTVATWQLSAAGAGFGAFGSSLVFLTIWLIRRARSHRGDGAR